MKTPEERLTAFVRDKAPGQCRMLSMGDDCVCPLCDIARLQQQIADVKSSRDLWKEQCLGKHDDPTKCPAWHDWCHCGGTLTEHIAALEADRDRLRKAMAADAIREAVEQGEWEVFHGLIDEMKRALNPHERTGRRRRKG